MMQNSSFKIIMFICRNEFPFPSPPLFKSVHSLVCTTLVIGLETGFMKEGLAG